MSEFDAFESAEQPQTEEDPAAAFLAREQDQLAGLEDDDGFGQPAGAEHHDQNQQDKDMLGDDFAGFENVEAQPAQENTSNDFFEPLGDSDRDTQQTSDTGFDPYGSDSESKDPYGAIHQVDKQRAEPEKIRIWREEQKQILEEKDAQSEKLRGEWAEVAKKELEDWYRHRAEQLEKTKVNNRDAERDFVHERDEKIPGHEWERICRLCEFNPKVARSQKDVARMRSILLQLKQTPLSRS